MFVRQKKNKSGLISVQVIDKSFGKYKVAKTIGSSTDKLIIHQLIEEALLWIKKYNGVVELDFEQKDKLLEDFVTSIKEIKVAGIDLILGKLFTEIGFNAITDELFKKLVIARLCYPSSKLKTVDHLRRYEGYETNETAIYRYLDKLYKSQKRLVQDISYQHTLKVLNQTLQIVFYDVTTLYFEAEQEDDLRKTGFSKDGKHQQPQIVLGLLVSKGGYPLAYEIYNGKKYEGDTMMPVLNLFKRKYKLKNLVVVADAGLLSTKNIESLKNNGYQYILGARIKNESKVMKEKILSLKLENGKSVIIEKSDNTKLIISYSLAREKKDAANRKKGIEKLQKLIKAGKLTKTQINNKGYNKFLQMKGDVTISVDKTKIETDKKWDGLKGYTTNTTLTQEEVIENYGYLWQIEKAFRVSKSDIEVRPIYHFVQRRIEAHICICFIAYKIYKELERQLKIKESKLSPEKTIEIAKTIYSIKALKPLTNELFEKTLLLNDEQRELIKLFYP
jgi:transposase